MYGQTIRKIRKDKGLTQKDVCQGVVTLSYYSRIERNISTPTIDIFMEIIKNLNVRLEEFMYIHNGYQKALKDQTWFEITELYHVGNMKGLEDYKTAILTGKLPHEEEITIQLINLFIYRLGGNVVAENITNIVQNLMNLENWTSREVTMFITIMDEIPIETLLIIVNRLLKKRNLYSASDGYNSPYSKILINTILLCVNNKYLNEGLSYLKQFREMLEIRDLYGKTMALFLEGLLCYAKGAQLAGTKKVNEAFQIFHLLEMDNFSRKYQQYFEYIKTIY